MEGAKGKRRAVMWLVGWVERVFYFIYSVSGGEGRGVVD